MSLTALRSAVDAGAASSALDPECHCLLQAGAWVEQVIGADDPGRRGVPLTTSSREGGRGCLASRFRLLRRLPLSSVAGRLPYARGEVEALQGAWRRLQAQKEEEMTKLLDQAMVEIVELPEDAQDSSAARLLADLADEHAWAARLAATTDAQWDRMAAMVRQGITAGDTTPLDDVFPSLAAKP